MTSDALNQLFRGGTATACLAAGVFFLRFYRTSRERLFLHFALALGVLAIHWALLGFAWGRKENVVPLYATRAAAFVLLIFGIVRKNQVR